MQGRPKPLSRPYLHIHEFPKVMAEPREKREVLPAWTVSSGLETVHAAIRMVLGDDGSGEFLQHLQGNLERVPNEAKGFAMVMIGAGRQVAHQVAKPRNEVAPQVVALVGQ